MSNRVNKEAEQAEKNKEAVASMRNALANMKSALARIAELETALSDLAYSADGALHHIPDGAYIRSSTESCKQRLRTAIEKARRELS